jgi:hypothetical protein
VKRTGKHFTRRARGWLIWDLRIQYAGKCWSSTEYRFLCCIPISRHLGSLAKNGHLLNSVFIIPFKMDSSQSHHITSSLKLLHNPNSNLPREMVPVPCGGVFGLSCSFQPTRSPRQDLGVPIHHAIGRFVSLQ